MATTINSSAGVTTNSGAVYNGLQSGTVVSATGTSVDFTGIPAWVKRITVMFSGVSTNGTSVVQVQLGDSGGIENTGYSCQTSYIGSAVNTSSFTAGFGNSIGLAATQRQGHYIITIVSGNTWVASNCIADPTGSPAGVSVGGGSKTLSATLDRIRITTANGTDTFDAGTINIIYE